MLDWLHKYAWWLAILSALLGVLSLVAGFTILVKLPEDHFLRMAEDPAAARSSRPAHPVLRILKNLLGIAIMLTGIIMALPLIPGPGLILVVIGVSLTSFPGKRKLELKLLRAPLALGAINWLRSRVGRAPLRLPSAAGRAIS